ncbi:MAG: hypothetical protein LUG60_07560 [Erysipelotrichaceae bacterium]|nr:hypothetical protein [Erysipelotrichaceae bacterium]
MSKFKILCVCLLLFIACSCEDKSKTVSLEKDGTLYEITDQASFYYPNRLSIDTSSDNIDAVHIVDDDEIMTYFSMEDDTDNLIEDMPDLYQSQLEEYGATDVSYHKITLDSGLECYKFYGIYSSSGMKFEHVVFFTTECTYALTYQAAETVYDENIDEINQYLESLTVHY